MPPSLSTASPRWSRPPAGRRRRRRCGGGPGPVEQPFRCASARSRAPNRRRATTFRCASSSASALPAFRPRPPSMPQSWPSAPSPWRKVSPEDPFQGLADPSAPRQGDPRSRPFRRDRDLRRAAEGGRAGRRGGGACRARASPIPAAAAPPPASAAWCWPPRTAFSANMSARASRARPASSPARARRWSATTTIPRACISPISTRPRRSAARPASARSAAQSAQGRRPAG